VCFLDNRSICLCCMLLHYLCTLDTLTVNYENDRDWQPVGLIKTDIAWTTDKRSKYGNPSGFKTDMRGGNVDEFQLMICLEN